MRWRLEIGAAMAVVGIALVYLTVCVGRFRFVQKLSGGKKGRRILLSAVFTAAFVLLLSAFMSAVNVIVVLLHLLLFFLLFGLIVRIAERVRGKKFRLNWQGLLALGCCAVWLTAGYVLCHEVRQKDYMLETDKELGTLRVALIADSHLGTTFDGEGFAEQLAVIAAQEPDLLVITGDFVDDSSTRADLVRACEALGETEFPYGVWYVYGNHDRGYGRGRGFTAGELEELLLQNGVHVLKDEAVLVDGRFYVAGRLDASFGQRLSAGELLAGLDADKYIIVLDHQPGDYENESRTAADLVLSGHTHGGQLIPINRAGEWLGVNDRTYGHERREGTDFIVTSGISDWELLFKTGTRSEYVVITVRGK